MDIHQPKQHSRHRNKRSVMQWMKLLQGQNPLKISSRNFLKNTKSLSSRKETDTHIMCPGETRISANVLSAPIMAKNTYRTFMAVQSPILIRLTFIVLLLISEKIYLKWEINSVIFSSINFGTYRLLPRYFLFSTGA